MNELSCLHGSERYAACADDEPRFPLPFSISSPLSPTLEAPLNRASGVPRKKKAAATADGALFYVQICAILYQNP